MNEGLTLITGGARSGKSAYAERLAAGLGRPVLFVATAEGQDDDMRRRIERHRASRPADWQTLEEPLGVTVALRARFARALEEGQPESHGSAAVDCPVIVLDCVTLLVSNFLLAGRPVEPEIGGLIAWQRDSGAKLIAVTNEVGLGVVPDNALARQYRDLLGQTNQRLAAAAATVILMVAGLPLRIK